MDSEGPINRYNDLSPALTPVNLSSWAKLFKCDILYKEYGLMQQDSPNKDATANYYIYLGKSLLEAYIMLNSNQYH
jgi:hypothetical protein